MNKVIRIREGGVRIIYDDAAMEMMKSLGTPDVKRATHVEYDNKLQKWVAVLADMGPDNIGKPGTVIAITDKRQEAIDAELEYLRINM